MQETCLQKVVGSPVRADAFFRCSGVLGPQKTIRDRPSVSRSLPDGAGMTPKTPPEAPFWAGAEFAPRFWVAQGGPETPQGASRHDFQRKSGRKSGPWDPKLKKL